jgi:UDP-N-acetylmuramoyl-L-alanyl-D-glutamate--2,6-diaminopimelate ligase
LNQPGSGATLAEAPESDGVLMSIGDKAPAITRPVAAAGPWAEQAFTVGVTGTNGKTSTTLMVAEVLRSTGDTVAVETTIGASSVAGHFTPRGDTSFFGRMREAVNQGTSRFAIEVTSEALATGWAKKWRFDLGVFTNLTQDHLDAHGSFEHYLASKAQLFVHLGPGKTAVLNAADPSSLLLDRVIPSDVQRVWYASPRRGPALTAPHLAIERLTVSLDGTRAELVPSSFAEQLGGTVETPLIGGVFAENALAAACVGLSLNMDAHRVRQALSKLARVPGRFEVVAREPVVVVDYAHTPDALERTCDAARGLAESLGNSRLIVVFGAGGNRDPNKRGPMGEAVGARADIAVVTSDNPRREDPSVIAAAVVAGCQNAGRAQCVVEPDRRRAIERAISMAHPRDVIVVCGKGHETGQEIGDRKLPFDDAEVVRQLLS